MDGLALLKMIRLKDIAREAGVSVMTVSKALRDAPDIAARTKLRIGELAERMGYTPNLGARSLRNQETKLLGLVIPATTDPIFARIVMAIEQCALERGYELILHHSWNEPEREKTILENLISRRVDGIFLSPVYRMESEVSAYRKLKKRGIPTVIMGPLTEFCKDFVNVQTLGNESAFSMTQHLIELGHKRIAFFAGPRFSARAISRQEGYVRALRENGIDEDPSLVFNGGTTIIEGSNAAKHFLEEKTKATAIQTVNDLVAIGAANVFLDQGLKIPDELSIAGFGNILSSEHYRVPLTTIRQPKFRMGMEAFDTMLKLIAKEKAQPQRMIGEVLVRQSTGPVKIKK
jgi:LacI family transcriptional regulator